MSWQAVVRLILVILLVLGLVGSLSLGVIGSAFSLPVSAPAQAFEVQAGDHIDGWPAEEYAGSADDFPFVQAPLAGICTKDGRLLFERNIDQRVTMASTTKMMTAIIALDTKSLDTPLTVTYGAANTDGTSAGLQPGMVISLLDCLYALLLPSGNDAAVVIAENISGMESRFVELMNAKAAELGMSSTHYADASGLSVSVESNAEGHYTTVRDYLLLTRYCMSNATFRQIVATSYYEVDIGGTLMGFTTTDNLVDYLIDAQPLGVKTGYTDEAGYCFVGAGNLGGIELYTVVFNAETGEQRFADTAALLNWGFTHYRTVELINTTQQVAEVALLSWIDETAAAWVPAVTRVEIFDLGGPITQEITINDIEGEASKGKRCGEIIWSQRGEVLTTSDVVVGETVLAPDFWEGLGIAWQRFWGGFSGEPEHATTTILLKDELTVPAASQLPNE
jgi:D-alanyl-D-alanine carboxypeptidase (penicillin-binding protein 5/6)